MGGYFYHLEGEEKIYIHLKQATDLLFLYQKYDHTYARLKGYTHALQTEGSSTTITTILSHCGSSFNDYIILIPSA